MIIGCQVTTFSGGKIDLLCINDTGDLVIVELKRNKTPREVTAQALEYASWVTDFPSDRVRGIADRYLGKRGPFRVFTNTEEIDRFLSGLVPT